LRRPFVGPFETKPCAWIVPSFKSKGPPGGRGKRMGGLKDHWIVRRLEDDLLGKWGGYA